ncbi:hypothetical protein KAI19_04690, partial [bacterium]|nr:hypothetical protein [bacterium]
MRNPKFKFSILILAGFWTLTFSEHVYGETPEIAVFQRPPLVKKIDKKLEEIHPGEEKGANVKLTIISTWKEGNKYTVNMSIKNLNKEQGYRTVYLLSYDNEGRIVAISSDRKYFKPYQEYFKQ